MAANERLHIRLIHKAIRKGDVRLKLHCQPKIASLCSCAVCPHSNEVFLQTFRGKTDHIYVNCCCGSVKISQVNDVCQSNSSCLRIEGKCGTFKANVAAQLDSPAITVTCETKVSSYQVCPSAYIVYIVHRIFHRWSLPQLVQ